MVWTVTRSPTTGNGTITLQADGTTSENLSVLLAQGVTAGLVGLSNPTPGVYQTEPGTILEVRGATGDTTTWLYQDCDLICLHYFYLRNNARFRPETKNKAGLKVKRPSFVLSAQPYNYFDGAGIFSRTQGGVMLAENWDFMMRAPGGLDSYMDGGAIFDEGLSPDCLASYKGCTFTCDANQYSGGIYYLGFPIVAGGATFSDCRFLGFPSLETANTAPLLNILLELCAGIKNRDPGNYVIDRFRFIDCGTEITARNGGQWRAIDCLVTPTQHVIENDCSIVLSNSVEFLGSPAEANGIIYLQNPTTNVDRRRITSSSGKVSGGNSTGASVAVNSDRICVDVFSRSRGASNGGGDTSGTLTSIDLRSGEFKAVFAKYGREPQAFSFILSGQIESAQVVPFISAIDTQITQTNAATVAAYTGFVVNYSTQLVTRSSGTEAQLYDWLALEKASLDSSGVVVNGLTLPKCALPTLATTIYDRVSGAFAYNLRIVGSDFLTGGRTIAMASGRTLTFATAANHSAVKIAIPATGIVHFEQGGVATLNGTFAAGATINNGSASALTVLVDESQKANITTTSTGGGSITVISQTTLNFTGIIAGSTIGILNNSGVLIDSAIVPGTTYSLTLTYPGALLYSVRVRKYGSNVFANSFTLAPGTLSININQAVDPFVVLSESAAGALTGIAINYGSSLTTVSANRTLSQLYDYARWSISQLSNIDKTNPAIATTDGVIRSLNYNLSLTGTSTITGTGTLAVGSRTLFLGAAQTYSFDATVGATGKVSVVNGTTTLSIASYASGAKFDNSTATAAIVQVPYAELANATALTPTAGGGSVTPRSIPVTFTGFPTAANANGRSADATFGVQDVSSDVWHTYDASSGSVVISLSELATAPDYQLVVMADAMGWVRTPDTTIAADYSGTFDFSNLFREIVDENGDPMVGLGTQSAIDKITYDQASGRFEADEGAIDFYSVLDKKEILTSSQLGLTIFNSALVRQLNFIKNAYANLIQIPSPLTVAASTTATASPILTDFVVMRTGDPTADVFVHGLPSTAPGLSDRPEIRMGTTKFISSSASGGSGGSGPTAAQIRQEMDANSKLATVATQTARVDALIENSGGDRFKAKTLEAVIEQANKPVIK